MKNDKFQPWWEKYVETNDGWSMHEPWMNHDFDHSTFTENGVDPLFLHFSFNH